MSSTVRTPTPRLSSSAIRSTRTSSSSAPGPCGLFQVFELGLLGLKAHVVDSLKAPGGQCVELYPDKPIYDIPAVPVCTGQELTDRLLEQIRPFGAGLHLGQEVTEVAAAGERPLPRRDERGAPCSMPARSSSPAAWARSSRASSTCRARPSSKASTSALSRARIRARYADQDVVILGGGDSALDWALTLVEHARSVVLVHRRAGVPRRARVGREAVRAARRASRRRADRPGEGSQRSRRRAEVA